MAACCFVLFLKACASGGTEQRNGAENFYSGLSGLGSMEACSAAKLQTFGILAGKIRLLTGQGAGKEGESEKKATRKEPQ